MFASSIAQEYLIPGQKLMVRIIARWFARQNWTVTYTAGWFCCAGTLFSRLGY